MKSWLRKLRLAEVGPLFFLFTYSPVVAQIVPDATLPINSLITNQGNTTLIEGGTTEGSNLFHSFEQFSVSTGGTGYFNNTANIQNIFSRVTGGSVSNIDGVLRANSSANLFLLNPNGIVFGPNAQLNIGGSFVGSTASSINFADDTQFSANAPQPTPLLTISVPIGLGFGSNPGEIRVQNTGHNLVAAGAGNLPLIRSNSPTGLQVQPGKTLALVGGDVSLEGGILRTEGGRIELGSVDNGTVSLTPNTSGWALGYQDVPFFKDIRLSRRALADASGFGSGSIQVQGRQVMLVDGSVILIQNQGFLPGGTLSVNASESLEVNGTDPIARVPGGLENETLGFARGGDITISTPNLLLRTGAVVSTRTFGAAGAGNINLNVPESLELIGASPRDPRAVSNFTSLTSGSGPSGNIKVSTGKLKATDGAFLASVTRETGRGGDITIDATDSVELFGVNDITLQPSAISASTFGSGQGGRVIITMPRLVVKDGGRVDSSTLRIGSAGSVIINASDSVEVTGTVPGSRNPSLITSSANRLDELLRRALGLRDNLLTGTSGNVEINTNRLNVTDGGLVSVRNDGTGDAGSLRINTNSARLDNQAGVTASTQSGQGGNIKINSRDLLLMRRNSQISSSAGNAQTGGDGGQIDVNTNFLVAPPLENSDITANAFEGKGGNVNITASAIFGLVPRSRKELQTLLGTDKPNELNPARLLSNDITAISQTNPSLSGQVTFNTPDVDPGNGLVELPAELTDVSNLIAQGCSETVGPQASKFIITGRGGLPEDPSKPLNAETIWTDLRFIATQKHSGLPATTIQSNNSTTSLIEASRLEINSKGEAALTAAAPSANLEVFWLKPPSCNV